MIRRFRFEARGWRTWDRSWEKRLSLRWGYGMSIFEFGVWENLTSMFLLPYLDIHPEKCHRGEDFW